MGPAIFLFVSVNDKNSVRFAATKCWFQYGWFKMWENISNERFIEKYSRANFAGKCNEWRVNHKWKVNHFSVAVLKRSIRITTVSIVGGWGTDINSTHVRRWALRKPWSWNKLLPIADSKTGRIPMKQYKLSFIFFLRSSSPSSRRDSIRATAAATWTITTRKYHTSETQSVRTQTTKMMASE